MKLRNTLWIDVAMILAVLILIILVSLNAPIPTRNMIIKANIFSLVFIVVLKFLTALMPGKRGIILFEAILLLMIVAGVVMVLKNPNESTDNFQVYKDALLATFPVYGYLILYNVQLWNDRNS